MEKTFSGLSAFFAGMLARWTKRDKVLAALDEAERRRYEYATVYCDESTTTNTTTTTQNQPSTPLLKTLTLLLRLPPELRTLIYTHILAPLSPTHTLQTPHLYRPSTYLPTTPLHFIPPLLTSLSTPSHPAHPSYPTHPAARAVIAELTIHLLSSSTIFARYRYDSTLLHFLSRDWMNRGVIPALHIRRLSILINPPKGAEDAHGNTGDEEFEWGAVFPVARNVRVAALKERVERDLLELGKVVGERCVVEVVVCVDGWEEEGGIEGRGYGAMRVWLGGLVREWKGSGRRLVVKIVGRGYEVRELEF